MRPLIPLLLCLSWGASAHAEPLRRPALHWVRAEGSETCIDPRALSERVQALTGPVLVRAADSDISIEGEVRPLAPKGFRARVTVSDRNGRVLGERVIDEKSENCRAFDDAVAFIIAITIDPSVELPEEMLAMFASESAPEEALLEQLEEEAPKPVVVAPLPEREEAQKTAPKEQPAVERAPPKARYDLAFGGLLVSGMLPSLGSAASLALHGLVHSFAFGASARVSQTVREPIEPDAEMSLRAYEGALSGCYVSRITAGVSLRGCIGPEVSVLHATGARFDVGHARAITAIGGALSPQLQVALWRRLSVRVEGLGRVNIRRPRFTYQPQDVGEQTAFLVPRFAFGGLLSAVVSF